MLVGGTTYEGPPPCVYHPHNNGGTATAAVAIASYMYQALLRASMTPLSSAQGLGVSRWGVGFWKPESMSQDSSDPESPSYAPWGLKQVLR